MTGAGNGNPRRVRRIEKQTPQSQRTIEAFYTNPLDEGKDIDAMKHHDYKALERIMKHLESAPKTRRIVWAALFVAFLFALRLSDLIAAIRWW